MPPRQIASSLHRDPAPLQLEQRRLQQPGAAVGAGARADQPRLRLGPGRPRRARARVSRLIGSRPAQSRRVARAIAELNLRHAVITSVDRDDLADGGRVVLVRDRVARVAVAELRARGVSPMRDVPSVVLRPVR